MASAAQLAARPVVPRLPDGTYAVRDPHSRGPVCIARSPWPTAATSLRRARHGSCSGCCWSVERS
jgi:hypothetical protein